MVRGNGIASQEGKQTKGNSKKAKLKNLHEQ